MGRCPPAAVVYGRAVTDATGGPEQDRDIAVLTFSGPTGAERAYAHAVGRVRLPSWAAEVLFVEHHRRERMILRGTFAGHYLDVDDLGDAMGRDTAEGAVAGAVVGVLFGPLGIAVGFVSGGIAGGVADAEQVQPPPGALFEEVRSEVPEGSSALVIYAAPGDVDAMIAAFPDAPAATRRHRVAAAEQMDLEAAIAQAPAASTRPGYSV